MYSKIEFVMDKDENQNALDLFVITHEIGSKAMDIGHHSIADIMLTAHNALASAYTFGKVED
jgi:hypothetical protein